MLNILGFFKPNSFVNHQSASARENDLDGFTSSDCSSTFGRIKMQYSRRKVLMVAAVAALCVQGLATTAQAQYPEKPISIIYPWSPGQPFEVVLRKLSEEMAKELGQPVVINTVAGAGGKKSMVAAANAKPDGYTLVNNWVAPQIACKLFDPSLPYDNNDFTPISGVMAIPFTMTVSKSHPANTMLEFIDWSKQESRTLNFGVCAPQSVPRLVGEQFMRVAGLKFNSIPNSGGCMSDNMTGLLNGSLDISVGIVPATQIMEGQLKHLVLLSDSPHPLAPDLATTKEVGLEIGWGSAVLGWGGLAAPAGTPDDVLVKLRNLVGRILQDEAFLKDLGPLRNMIDYKTPEDFQTLWTDTEVLLSPHVAVLKKDNN
jgi:tripartite-type tricarboxylate transporter receptor subunit TctC